MAAKNTFSLVLLSSSPPASDGLDLPPTPPRAQRVGMPAISPIACRQPDKKLSRASGTSSTTSRGAPIPEGAVRGFATASSLVKAKQLDLEPDLDPDLALDKDLGALALRKPGNGFCEADAESGKLKKPDTKVVLDNLPDKKPSTRRRRIQDHSLDDISHTRSVPTTSSHFHKSAAGVSEVIEIPDEVPLAVTKTKPTKARKPRVKKDTGKKNEDVGASSGVAQAPKRKATRKTAPVNGNPKKKTTAATSAHFRDETDNLKVGAGISDALVDDAAVWDVPKSPSVKMDVEGAIARKLDWTPVKDTARVSLDNSSGKENNASVTHGNKPIFTDMLHTFTFEDTDTTTTKQPIMEKGGATKKRRVELIDLPAISGATRKASPEKGKAPKKKPRTITALVTEQYAEHLRHVPAEDDATKSDFFSPRPTTLMVPLNDIASPALDEDARKVTRRRTSTKVSGRSAKENVKSKKAAAKATAKPKLLAEKLLSPSSAMVRVSNQDILFGTSSQLALEESPTTIREIQRAIEQSEQDHARLPGLAYDTSPLQLRARFGRTVGGRSLWGASARDGDGNLLQNANNVYIPEPDRTQDLPLLMDGTNDATETSFADIDNFEPIHTITVSSDPPLPKPASPSKTSSLLKNVDSPLTQKPSSSFDDINNYEPPPPSGQGAETSFVDIDEFDLPTQKHLTSTGSPKKPRGRPPKAPAAKPSRPSVAAASKTSRQLSPRKITGRAPGTPTRRPNRFLHVEEILDSEDDEALSPTPPRTIHRLDSSPLPLMSLGANSTTKVDSKLAKSDEGLVPVLKVPSEQIDWDGVKAGIYSRVTAHIRALPPSTTLSPSWHEKILMYDPIVLEDFTTYLNTNTTIRVYRRANQKQVKAYNAHLKSQNLPLLPLWKPQKGKETAGGKGRKLCEAEEVEAIEGDEHVDGIGFGDREALVVEKELEPWMVQAWCQEYSVCCVSWEGRKGGARKGLY